MSEYNHELVGTIGVSTETYSGRKLPISVGVDTHGMCVVSFGTSYSIRINEDDVDALRRILHDASRMLMQIRVDQEFTDAMTKAGIDMASETDDYNPEAEVAELYRS